MQKEGGPNRINGVCPEYWAKLNRIFGGRTPSTSTRRSSRSTESTSSTRSSGVYKQVIKVVGQFRSPLRFVFITKRVTTSRDNLQMLVNFLTILIIRFRSCKEV